MQLILIFEPGNESKRIGCVQGNQKRLLNDVVFFDSARANQRNGIEIFFSRQQQTPTPPKKSGVRHEVAERMHLWPDDCKNPAKAAAGVERQ